VNYLDFDLLIERAEKKYKARVLNSPAGQAAVEFSLPFGEAELENFILKIAAPRAGRINSPELEAAAKVFGSSLFEAVFNDELLACFRSSLDEAARQGVGLRLRLRLADVPELADMPWEYLHYPKLNRFLSLSVETPIVRYLDMPERIRCLAIDTSLRILVMISNPADYPQLNVEQEWAKLNNAFSSLKRRRIVELDRLDRATWLNLQTKLREREYHIFHFIGHGGFDRQANDGMLIFEDENNRSRPVSGQKLGMLLRDERMLRLALLNVCEGGRSGRCDPFAGAAQSLVQQGIPAVIAMQFAVTDETAIALVHQFYDALADGYAVDSALAEARRAIFGQQNNIEWGTPVLYMRSPDGHIFDLVKTRPNITPPPAGLIVRQGANHGQAISLGAESKIIGREAGQSVVLPDPDISRRHARIGWQGSRYILEDLGSTNGTFCNDVQIIGSQPLCNGDVIRLGRTVLVFQLESE